MKKEYEKMTMAQLKDLLEESVSDYNDATDAVERVKMEAEQAEIVKAYNELALLTEYAFILKAEIPMVALGKQYYYETLNVRNNVHSTMIDGIKTTECIRVITTKDTKFNIIKFVEWCEEGNHKITPDDKWRSAVEDARVVIEEEWRKFFAAKGDTKAISIGKCKKALQSAIDALVFVKTKTDKNAIVANGDVAKWVIANAVERKDSKVDGAVKITGTVLARNKWNVLLLDILHLIVEKKSYNILYGDEVEEELEETTEAETETETK